MKQILGSRFQIVSTERRITYRNWIQILGNSVSTYFNFNDSIDEYCLQIYIYIDIYMYRIYRIYIYKNIRPYIWKSSCWIDILSCVSSCWRNVSSKNPCKISFLSLYIYIHIYNIYIYCIILYISQQHLSHQNRAPLHQWRAWRLEKNEVSPGEIQDLSSLQTIHMDSHSAEKWSYDCTSCCGFSLVGVVVQPLKKATRIHQKQSI